LRLETHYHNILYKLRRAATERLNIHIHACTYLPTDTYAYINIYKGKAIPLQAWTGLEGSRRLRLSDFKTIGI